VGKRLLIYASKLLFHRKTRRASKVNKTTSSVNNDSESHRNMSKHQLLIFTTLFYSSRAMRYSYRYSY
jgi:hypothetical protein